MSESHLKLKSSALNDNTQIKAWKKQWEAVIFRSGCIFYFWEPETDNRVYLGDTERILGYTGDQLIHGFFIHHIHLLDIERVKAEILAAKKAKRPFSIKYRFHKEDGSHVILQDAAYPVLKHSNTLAQFAGFIQDITEQVREMASLREKEKRYRELVESQQELIFRVDLKGRFTFVNDAYCKKFGKTQKELIGAKFFPLMHREDLNGAAEVMKRLEIPPYRIYFENRVLTVDGWCWMAWEQYAIKNVKGETVEIQATGRDITERKRVEGRLKSRTTDLEIAKAELEEDKAKDDALLASIGDGMIATDNHGRVTKINKVAQQMLGFRQEEVIGKYVHDIIHIENHMGEGVPKSQRPTTRALYTGDKTITQVYFYVRKDRTKFPVEVTVTPVVLNKRIIGTIEVFRDITREMEVDRAKSELLSLASHQLRTPLSTISWYGEALLKNYKGPISDIQRDYLEQIYSTTSRMMDLVNDFLNVSRIELGTFTTDPEPVNVVGVVRSVIDELEQLIREKNLLIEEKYDDTIPVVYADPNHMWMVFQNLLTNAVKYTPKGGTIRLEITTIEDEKLFIKIADTGYGIPQKQQAKIFTKLFRADNIKERDTEGTGLGLYIVKSIVTQSKGEIWFKSEEGKGSIFYVTLPLGNEEIKK